MNFQEILFYFHTTIRICLLAQSQSKLNIYLLENPFKLYFAGWNGIPVNHDDILSELLKTEKFHRKCVKNYVSYV